MDVYTAQAVLKLRRDLYRTWETLTAGRDVDQEAFREFFPPFVRYAERLLKVEIKNLSRVPLKTVVAKVHGFWPNGEPEGSGLRTEVILRIAPQPPFYADRRAAQKLLDLRLMNDHIFHEYHESRNLPAVFAQAVADVGIENNSEIFEVLRSLPKRCLGDWFNYVSQTWGNVRKPFTTSAKNAEICQNFSLAVLDHEVWKAFFDTALSALCILSERLLNERAVSEMERAKPRRRALQSKWEREMVGVLGSTPQNPEACKFLDDRQVSLPVRVTWKNPQGNPARTWVEAFEAKRSTVESYLSKFRKRWVSK